MSDNDYPLSWEEKQLRRLATATATKRVEYLFEALIGAQGRPDADATWEQWGGPFDSLDDPLAQSRLNFLRTQKGKPGGRNRILDYRVLRREVITTEWEEVKP